MKDELIENFLKKKYKPKELENGLYFSEMDEITRFLGDYNEHLSMQEKLQRAADKAVSGIYEAQNALMEGTIKTTLIVDAGFTEEMLKATFRKMAEAGWSMAYRHGSAEVTADNKVQVTGWVEWYLKGEIQTQEAFNSVFKMFALSIYNAKIGASQSK